MRNVIDYFLRMSIKLCLLTGVAFTFAACYAPAPPDENWMNEPDYKKDQQTVEQQLQAAAQVQEAPESPVSDVSE